MKRLDRKIEAIKKAVRQHEQPGRLEYEVKVDKHYDGCSLTEILIDPTTEWYVEGQLGMDSFQIILGPRGGLRYVGKRMVTTMKKLKSWEELFDYIEMAM